MSPSLLDGWGRLRLRREACFVPALAAAVAPLNYPNSVAFRLSQTGENSTLGRPPRTEMSGFHHPLAGDSRAPLEVGPAAWGEVGDALVHRARHRGPACEDTFTLAVVRASRCRALRCRPVERRGRRRWLRTTFERPPGSAQVVPDQLARPSRSARMVAKQLARPPGALRRWPSPRGWSRAASSAAGSRARCGRGCRRPCTRSG